MNSITPALIDYWQNLPARTTASRRRSLDEAQRDIDAGTRGVNALVPYALADHDDDIVFAATSAYVGIVRDAHERNAAAREATEWVRRGLAINRGAVFAALLALGDDGINERLLPLRLALTDDEIATVCRRIIRRSCEQTQAFLREWHELLFGENTAPARAHVATSLGIGEARVA